MGDNIIIRPSSNKISAIKSPEVIYIIKTIKQIQSRMKDRDITNLEYIRVYDILSKEFTHFFDRYTSIFVSVIKGENLATLASVLYYRDQVLQGLLTEKELADKLATRYLPANLKAESDKKLKEMEENGDINKINNQ